MNREIVGIAVEPEDKIVLDRLVQRYGGGDRSVFLREAIRVMASRERAERLQRVQERIHAQIGQSGAAEEIHGVSEAASALATAIREAQAVMTAYDDTPPQGMDAFFYAQGYNGLRFALEDLLSAIQHHLGHSR